MSNNSIDLLSILKEKLSNKEIKIEPGALSTAAIVASSTNFREVVKVMLHNDEKTALVAITGIDLGENIGVFYHIRASTTFMTLKVEVPKENPKIDTITDLIPGASFHELEVTDLLGVIFEGHPSPGRLVLPENWPDGVYPLRKDVNVNDIKLKPLPASETASPEDEKLVKIIIGPQHPALLEPEKFAVTVEGETVKKVDPRIGYVHRGIEKLAESKSYIQGVYLVERICGICNSCHAVGYVESVEKILKTQVPLRAKYLRTIILELNRLHSHLLLLGHAGLEIGYEALFQYMWRDREPIMDLTEMLTGNRVVSSSMTVGGVRLDLKQEHIPIIKNTLNDLRKKMVLHKGLYEDEPTLKMRMQKVGVLSKEDAIKLCVAGPVARGSGVDIDVRKDEPYSAYEEIPFKLITYNQCDTWARMMVRIDEVEESIKIIEYALDNLPAGPVRVKVPRVVPAGEVVTRVEAPRGELFYYIKTNGTTMPERVKVRTPTFANLPSFIKTAVGQSIADVPANFVSLDPCFSCTDR